ncbi:MAG: PSD1 and planctomycete cytochrome C domain-containing protein [Pirellulaceae bacterium]
MVAILLKIHGLRYRPLFCALLALSSLVVGSAAPRATLAAAPRIEFNRDIRPILSDKCFACHGPDEKHREADLRLDTAEGAKSAITAEKPEASELIARITSEDESERMPPSQSKKTLSPREIELLRQWVAQGAEYQPHWSFVPPRRGEAPAVKQAAWPAGDIDRFILARLEAEAITPSPEADKITLARRLAFDLTGLPPTPAEVRAFVQDESPDAYERLVDRLLDSPHYGERMAMYWLDLVRYADTVGYHGDQEHAITPYRDWVIKAFNDNMPFDQFTIEQLAGDLLPDATIDQKIASGYNRVLQTSHEGGVQKQEYLHKYDADRVRSLSGVWMGATLGCAECHNHKFDPYTQKDFYSLAAFFADIDDMQTFRGGDTTPTKREPELVVISPIDRAQIAAMMDELEKLKGPYASAAAGSPDANRLEQRIAALKQEIASRQQAKRRTMVTASVEPRTIRVLERGDWLDDSGEVVEPATPRFMGRLDVGDRRATRLDLAHWLTSDDHPQTSRVLVNRLWHLFFGAGLSDSLEDTGAQGEWPTHPKLLDWLAVELVDSGWDVKHLVKLLVVSRTYCQSSLDRPELRQRDPANRLYARQSRWRLPAEMVRDNALSVSGLLVDRLGGPSSRPYQPEGYYAHLNFPKRKYVSDKDAGQYRRGVYMHWQRQFLHPMLKAFDAPSREECTARRPVSNTPSAALTLLNDPTFVEAARVFAQRILRDGGKTAEQRLAFAWRECLSREPSADELHVLAQLFEQNLADYRADAAAAESLTAIGLAPRPKDLDTAELAAWTTVARALLNLHETITRT